MKKVNKEEIIIDNIIKLFNNDDIYSKKCSNIYNYLNSLNIEYDDLNLLKKMKRYNKNFYNIYENVIKSIYENLHTNNNTSDFDDYIGYNVYNENTYLYNKIKNLLNSYNEEDYESS